MILTPLLKLPKNGEDWCKLIFAKGFKKLPKIQNIAQSGHTGAYHPTYSSGFTSKDQYLDFNWLILLCSCLWIRHQIGTMNVKLKKYFSADVFRLSACCLPVHAAGINTTKLFLPYLNDGAINYCQGPIPKIFGICMQGQILTILGENSVTGSFTIKKTFME